MLVPNFRIALAAAAGTDAKAYELSGIAPMRALTIAFVPGMSYPAASESESLSESRSAKPAPLNSRRANFKAKSARPARSLVVAARTRMLKAVSKECPIAMRRVERPKAAARA